MTWSHIHLTLRGNVPSNYIIVPGICLVDASFGQVHAPFGLIDETLGLIDETLGQVHLTFCPVNEIRGQVDVTRWSHRSDQRRGR